MAAYKFTISTPWETNDGEYYLESMEDRVFFNALYFADGDEAIATDIANKSSTNATNQLLLPFWTQVVLVVLESWYLVSWFK